MTLSLSRVGEVCPFSSFVSHLQKLLAIVEGG
jgi:hypothetical protein